VRSDREDYYVILGYAANPRIEEIRHAYLHVRLNSYLAAAVGKVPNGDSLLSLLNGVEGVPRAYSTNFETMLTESFVRAIEIRMDREPAARARESLRNVYRSGLLLAPYFYDALIAYEASDSALRTEITTIAGAVDLSKERTRFVETFHSITLPERQPLRAEVPTPPKADPVLDLLRSAQAVFDKDKPRAREAFEKVLKDYDANNGRALYGIGLIEMDNANRAASDIERDAALNAALGFFERTVASTSADRSMKTWSHIYAGHILDFRCKRQAAIDHYRKAIESGDDTRDAQKTAQRDLAQPFGGECQQ
jgi:tetratricopeptide (TPR) repeat protein